MTRRAWALNDKVRTLASERGFTTVEHRPAWYGFDPIHLKRRIVHEAWPTMLASWRAGGEAIALQRASWWMSAYMAGLAPWERSLLGIRRRAAQPSARFSDGTTISLY